jgi:F0F1-type ATP synthase epsilon subunit
MPDGLGLRVWTPSETLVDGKGVIGITAQLTDGEIGLLPGHTNLIAETVDGLLRWEDHDGWHQLDLFGGILRIQDEQVYLFTGGIRSETEDLLREVQLTEDAVYDRLARQLMTGMGYEP